MSFEARDGTYQVERPDDDPCRKCGAKSVVYRVWESSCGGFEDYRYDCKACGASWWVDGIDS